MIFLVRAKIFSNVLPHQMTGIAVKSKPDPAILSDDLQNRVPVVTLDWSTNIFVLQSPDLRG